MFLSFPRYRLFHLRFLLHFKMSAHQTNKDNPRSVKCRYLCFAFDSHNYCPTCRESGKGDDPCVTFESPCAIYASFTEEQMIKITHRKHYVKKQKRDTTSSKDDELDLLGDEVLPYSRRLNQIWKNPWVTHLTSIYSSNWVPSRHLC